LYRPGDEVLLSLLYALDLLRPSRGTAQLGGSVGSGRRQLA